MYNDYINHGDADMIKSRRDLAIALSKGEVSYCSLSKALHSTVALWIKRREIIMVDGILRMAV